MNAIIKINMDNAAFDDCPGVELARILVKLALNAKWVSEAGTVLPAYDVNGNKVGELRIEED